MKITDKTYFREYFSVIGSQIKALVGKYDFSSNNGDLLYLTKASAVYSSNIEGNSIDLNSYMNQQMAKEKFKPGKELEEINNLVAAYQYAQAKMLNETHFLYCHKMLSETLLIESKRGSYREEAVGVFGKSGLAYLAIEPEFVQEKMSDFFTDIKTLLSKELTLETAFYFASLIHLQFVHIHPFMDGNGRAARLLEKWFLANALGNDFWKIPSEEHYKNNQQAYYAAINLGPNYYALDYSKCMDFLVMLPKCLHK